MLNKLKREIFKPGLTFDNHLLANRLAILKRKNINTILDVGANIGQYAESILNNWQCNIISFEPMQKEFLLTREKSVKFKNWVVYNYGLGDKNEEVNINISQNSYSSSLLPLNDETIKYAADIAYVDSEKVKLNRLDEIWDELNINDQNILLKIDAQGYEYNILKGAEKIMNKIWGLQLEMSIVQLYKNEVIFEDMYAYVKNLGFDLYIIEPGFADPKTGKLLQLEAIFFKSDT